MSGVDEESRPEQAIQLSGSRPGPVWETHLSGEQWVSPNTWFEMALYASVWGNLNNQG